MRMKTEPEEEQYGEVNKGKIQRRKWDADKRIQLSLDSAEWGGDGGGGGVYL